MTTLQQNALLCLYWHNCSVTTCCRSSISNLHATKDLTITSCLECNLFFPLFYATVHFITDWPFPRISHQALLLLYFNHFGDDYPEQKHTTEASRPSGSVTTQWSPTHRQSPTQISHGITNLHHYVKAAYTWLFTFAWEQTNALVNKTLGGWAFTFNNIV